MGGIIIKDELYGTISLSELERRIIDTSDFQRLRRIKQMAFSYLVYPCANHTRFEHSLGTMHISSLIADRLGIEGKEKEQLRLYALLHDIGHVAFSHESEKVLSRHIGSHEEIGKQKIMKGEIADALSENHAPKDIIALEKTPLSRIIDSDLGADRIDYLRRDAQNTGVAYGVIDSDRIIHTLELTGDGLAIDESGLIAAESLLIARFMMSSSAYFHHTVRIAGAMISKAIEAAISSSALKPAVFLGKGDEEILAELGRCDGAAQYTKLLASRQLFKEAASFDVAEVNDWKSNTKKIESALSKKCNCDIIIDWPDEFFKPLSVKVRTDNGLRDIEELSELVRSLKTNEEKRKRVLVLCPAENREDVKKTLEKSNVL